MKFSNPLRLLHRGRPSTSAPLFTQPVGQAPPLVTLEEVLSSGSVRCLTPFLSLFSDSPLLPSPSLLPPTPSIPPSVPYHHLSGIMRPHTPTSTKLSPLLKPHPRHHPSLHSLSPPSTHPSGTKLAGPPKRRRPGGHHQTHKPSTRLLLSACPSRSMPTRKETRRPRGCRQPTIER